MGIPAGEDVGDLGLGGLEALDEVDYWLVLDES